MIHISLPLAIILTNHSHCFTSYVAHTTVLLHCVHTTDIVYTDTGSRRALIDTNQEPISYRSICHVASLTVQQLAS